MTGRMSPAQLVIVTISLAVVGVASAIVATAIVVLTGSEAMTPPAGGVLGAALGLSAGSVIGRLLGRRRTVVDLLMQIVVAGGLAALTLWYIQHFI